MVDQSYKPVWPKVLKVELKALGYCLVTSPISWLGLFSLLFWVALLFLLLTDSGKSGIDLIKALLGLLGVLFAFLQIVFNRSGEYWGRILLNRLEKSSGLSQIRKKTLRAEVKLNLQRLKRRDQNCLKEIVKKFVRYDIRV